MHLAWLVPTTHSSLLAASLHHANALSLVTRADAIVAANSEDVPTGTKSMTLCIRAAWNRSIVTRANGVAAWVLPLALGVVRLLGAAEGQRKQLGIAHRHTDLDVLKRQVGHHTSSNVWIVLAPAYMTFNP